VLLVLLVLWLNRSQLTLAMTSAVVSSGGKSQPAVQGRDSLAFLAIPAVWVCFFFFLVYAAVISGIQAFAPEAARLLHAVPAHTAALCLTFYMVASACGMLLGGFLVSDPARSEKVVALAFSIAAALALTMAYAPVAPSVVPVIFIVMGVASGMAGPSRDLLVKRASPENATGRVYGVVYSGLDIGQAIAPLVYGALMDMHRPAGVWVGIAIVQILLVFTAFNVRRARRTSTQAAAA
jgi:predicted MFS family arabinose efflux permease